MSTLPLSTPIPSLARWGLSGDADLVFRTLATFGAQDARTMAADLGLPRQRVVTALSELHEYGAVTAAGGNAGSALWSNRPPADVVQQVRIRRMRSIDREAQARRHRAAFDALNVRLTGAGVSLRQGPAGPLGDGVRYLASRPVVRARISSGMAREKHEHLVVNTEETITPVAKRSTPFNEKRFRGTVKFRVLGRPPVDGDALDPDVSPEARFLDSVVSYRQTLDTPLKMFIFDRQTAMVRADPFDVERGYFEIFQPEIVRTLVELFESRWESAVDPRIGGVPAIALSARERDLVRLLARGHTDVTAAGELRISARTVTNTLRALMDRLGVDNRFQLGLALGALDVEVPPALLQ